MRSVPRFSHVYTKIISYWAALSFMFWTIYDQTSCALYLLVVETCVLWGFLPLSDYASLKMSSTGNQISLHKFLDSLIISKASLQDSVQNVPMCVVQRMTYSFLNLATFSGNQHFNNLSLFSTQRKTPWWPISLRLLQHRFFCFSLLCIHFG